jgi:hypothetical protein
MSIRMASSKSAPPQKNLGGSINGFFLYRWQADRTVITESEFLAFVREHPLLLHSLSEAGAKGMFYR